MYPSYIGKFTYTVPPLLSNPTVLIFIDLVLPMGWVNLQDLFCFALETFAENTNGYALDPSSAFAIYPPKAGAYNTNNAQTASPGHLQYVGVYMYDLLCVAQGDSTHQQWVSDITILTLKEIFPSFPD